MEYSIIVEIIVWSLIIYRISSDIADMDGPFAIFSSIRQFMWDRPKMPLWIATGMECVVCISFWFTCIIVVITMRYELFACAGIIRLISDWRSKGL